MKAFPCWPPVSVPSQPPPLSQERTVVGIPDQPLGLGPLAAQAPTGSEDGADPDGCLDPTAPSSLAPEPPVGPQRKNHDWPGTCFSSSLATRRWAYSPVLATET